MMNDNILFICFLAVLIICIICIFILSRRVIAPFLAERKLIRLEMERANSEEAYLYWKRELKKLCIAYIPIIGKRLLEYMDN